MVAIPYRFDPGHRHQRRADARIHVVARELAHLKHKGIDVLAHGSIIKFVSFTVFCLCLFHGGALVSLAHGTVVIHYYGLVAQLGERCVRNAEVEGSIPFRSTTIGEPPRASTGTLTSSLTLYTSHTLYRSQHYNRTIINIKLHNCGVFYLLMNFPLYFLPSL